MGAMDVQTLRLPLSHWVFQLREDGSWRELSSKQYEDELAARFQPRPEEWAMPTELFAIKGRAERPPGLPRAGPTWWLLYGRVRVEVQVQVTLADGRQPLVQTFGPVWLCEWVGEDQSAVLSIGETSATVFERAFIYRQSTDNQAQ